MIFLPSNTCIIQKWMFFMYAWFNFCPNTGILITGFKKAGKSVYVYVGGNLLMKIIRNHAVV
jgi:hypothetical protein